MSFALPFIPEVKMQMFPCYSVPLCHTACWEKNVSPFPEMSQMLLTLLHRREHLTLTQCSSVFNMYRSPFLFQQANPLIGVLHHLNSLRRWIQTLPNPHPIANIHMPKEMEQRMDRSVLKCCQLCFKLFKHTYFSRVNCWGWSSNCMLSRVPPRLS